MATGDISYTIWWTDPSAHEESYGYFSNYDVYSINWDGITNPTEVAITLSPQNYYFIYDCAEDTCFQTTYNNNSYCGSSFTLLSGRNKIVRIKPTSEYITADISIKSDGTIQFFNCNGVVNNSNIYVTIRSVPKYISNLSNGTDTYIIKDAEARTAIAGKQDTLVSGTNIKTINNTSILGSGNISTSELPSQSGNNGKFLTTNGTTASWATVTQPSIATTSTAGLVKPDGTSITITNDGTISASAGAYALVIVDYTEEGE